jgi:hypothetical protein
MRLVIMSKAKKLPEGTIREHGGKKVVKKNGKWVPAKGQSAAKADSKAEKGKQDVEEGGDIDSNERLPGGITLGQALQAIQDSAEDFTQGDAEDDEIAIFEALEERGLVEWDEDDHPMLTEEGRAALKGAK